MARGSINGKTPVLRRFLALAVVTAAAATFQLASLTAHAAQATLNWTAPTTYVDGTPQTTLKGFKVYAGTTAGNYTSNVDVGNVTSYVMNNLNDATTYYFAVAAYDSSGTLSALSNEASFMTASQPSASLYTLTAATATGGTISPSGSTVISQGASQTYTITPSSGYKIAGVTVDGTSVGAVSSYTFSNVTANHTIAATFVSSTGGTGTLTSSGTWQSQAIPAQNAAFTINFDMVPAANNIDAVTGLSAVKGASYTDLAAIVRFNTSGAIDARNGSSYAALTALPYSAGKSYHVRMQVDLPNHRYDAWVTPQGGAETQVAKAYAFRTEQATTAVLNYINAFAGTGSSQVMNVAVTAAPAVTSYTLSASAGTGGAISPSGTSSITSGGSKSYSITPAAGYGIADVKVDGTSVGAVSSYTFSNVSANHTIAASFASSSTGSAGTVTSSGTWQNQGIPSQNGAFTVNFDMVPGANNIDAVTGLSAVKGASYTDLAAIVRFNTSGAIDARNGSSYAALTALPYSAGKSYHVRMQVDLPNHRYDAWVTPQGGTETQVAKAYAFRTEQATATVINYINAFAGTGSSQFMNVSVTAAPAAPAVTSYTVSASAGTGGAISPAGTSSITSGGSKAYSITPAAGYGIADVKVDGASVGAVSSYTFSNVTANHTISATFTAVASYSIRATAYANGSISPAGTTTVAAGGSKTYTITPARGYQVAAVKIDGVSTAHVTSYTFQNVTANHTIAVSFAAL